jgi:hypothetical protein
MDAELVAGKVVPAVTGWRKASGSADELSRL